MKILETRNSYEWVDPIKSHAARLYSTREFAEKLRDDSHKDKGNFCSDELTKLSYLFNWPRMKSASPLKPLATLESLWEALKMVSLELLFFHIMFLKETIICPKHLCTDDDFIKALDSYIEYQLQQNKHYEQYERWPDLCWKISLYMNEHIQIRDHVSMVKLQSVIRKYHLSYVLSQPYYMLINDILQPMLLQAKRNKKLYAGIQLLLPIEIFCHDNIVSLLAAFVKRTRDTELLKTLYASKSPHHKDLATLIECEIKQQERRVPGASACSSTARDIETTAGDPSFLQVCLEKINSGNSITPEEMMIYLKCAKFLYHNLSSKSPEMFETSDGITLTECMSRINLCTVTDEMLLKAPKLKYSSEEKKQLNRILNTNLIAVTKYIKILCIEILKARGIYTPIPIEASAHGSRGGGGGGGASTAAVSPPGLKDNEPLTFTIPLIKYQYTSTKSGEVVEVKNSDAIINELLSQLEGAKLTHPAQLATRVVRGHKPPYNIVYEGEDISHEMLIKIIREVRAKLRKPKKGLRNRLLKLWVTLNKYNLGVSKPSDHAKDSSPATKPSSDGGNGGGGGDATPAATKPSSDGGSGGGGGDATPAAIKSSSDGRNGGGGGDATPAATKPSSDGGSGGGGASAVATKSSSDGGSGGSGTSTAATKSSSDGGSGGGGTSTAATKSSSDGGSGGGGTSTAAARSHDAKNSNSESFCPAVRALLELKGKDKLKPGPAPGTKTPPPLGGDDSAASPLPMRHSSVVILEAPSATINGAPYPWLSASQPAANRRDLHLGFDKTGLWSSSGIPTETW